jgi:hypothetical protein
VSTEVVRCARSCRVPDRRKKKKGLGVCSLVSEGTSRRDDRKGAHELDEGKQMEKKKKRVTGGIR